MSKASNTARAAKKPARTKSKAKPKAATKGERTLRTGSKQAKLIEMLKRPNGATIAEMAKALSWQPHTVRGAIAGALKKKLGLKVESEKVDAERGRVYRIAE
jgi:predicted ArsR family transcriptional regulator